MARPRKIARRHHGEGSVYYKTRKWKTKDGKVHSKVLAVAVTPGEDGKEFTGDTPEEAIERRDSWLREHGKPVPRSQRQAPITVREFSETFLANRKANKRGTTYRDYESTLRNHILPVIGNEQIAALTDDQVTSMYKRLESKVSPSMRCRVHRHLRALLNYALECKVIRISPLATIRQNVPRHKPRPVIPLEDSEIARLLEAAKGNRLGALIMMALDTGARQGELFALEWPDIDLKKGTIYIQRGASETVNGIVVDACKTEKSRRSIDLSPQTVRALKLRQAEAVREGLGGCRLLFPSEHGHVMRKSNFTRRVWEPLRKAAKVTAKFHTLRHTCAVLLLKAGVHPRIVQDRLGHASITLTMDTYSAWIPSLQAKAAEKMGETLGRLIASKRHLKAAA